MRECEHTAHSTLDDWEPKRGPRQPHPHPHTGPEGGASWTPYLVCPNTSSMHTMPRAPLKPYIHLREGRPRLVAIAMYVVLLQLYSNDDHLGKVSFDTIMYFVQAWSYPAMHETPI